MRWLAVGACVAGVAFWGCGANLTPPADPSGPTGARGGQGPPRATGNGGRDAGTADGAGGSGTDAKGITGAGGAAGSAAAGGGAGGSIPSGDQIDGGVVCPAAAPGDDAGTTDAGAAIARPAAAWSDPTPLPFSCAPMPDALFLPRPGADVAGVYGRCASFSNTGARTLAVSADGSRVALVEADGVARIVDAASHMVVGLLAPPRASIDVAAFSPAGDAIVTFAEGELVVTAWRSDTFTPIWSTTLAGQTYDPIAGITSFSPDGTTLLVSAGGDLFLLDAATGAIRATRAPERGVLLGAGYGLGGQRIAVEESPLTDAGTTCGVHPTGGTVTLLDPATLTPIGSPIDLTPPGQMPFFAPGQLLTAPEADLMLIERDYDSVPEAFRMSDGSALPGTGLTGAPLLATPDGTAALVAIKGTNAGTLQLQRIADGAVLASVAGAPTSAAISADASTIAVGGSGVDLLSVWRPTMALFARTCFADPQTTGSAQLSADGQIVAVAAGSQVQMRRRADAALLSTFGLGPDDQVQSVQLSPDGAHAIVGFYNSKASDPTSAFPKELFRTDGTVPPIDLLKAPAGGSWVMFTFPPDEDTMFALLVPKGTGAGGTIMSFQLSTGALSPVAAFHGYIGLRGVSGGCPVVSSGATSPETAWRACGSCNGPAFAPNTAGGIVSLDGRVYLSAQETGADLWQILPSPSLLRHYAPRPEAARFGLAECPVAVSGSGDAVVTAPCVQAPCTVAPRFTSRVRDVAADQVIDELPPGITSMSADLSVAAFDSVLWCSR